MALNDGGPAFPMSGDPNVEFDRGMSLRDYFASAALQGYSASYAGITQKMDSAHIATFAYELADAMISARAA